MTALEPPLTDSGEFGGAPRPAAIQTGLEALARAWPAAWSDPTFQAEYRRILRDHVGRPSPLSDAPRLALAVGGDRILLKREDLRHSGAHLIHGCIAQVLLARRLGKSRVVAGTGPGRHGVVTASACAHLGVACVLYMGAEDLARQALDVVRMRLLGAELRPVTGGAATLEDAIEAAAGDRAASVASTHFMIGEVLGPDPYPRMTRDLQRMIGDEARAQILDRIGRLPDAVIAGVGGGSSAMDLLAAFVPDREVALIGVEAIDAGDELEHADLRATGRARHLHVSDEQALAATALLARSEGIIPALATARAIAALPRLLGELGRDAVLLVDVRGRDDEDLSYLDPAALARITTAAPHADDRVLIVDGHELQT